MSKSPHQDDFLQIIELAVSGAEDVGENTVTLKTGLARKLLELAKQAPKSHGRPPVRGRDKVQVAVVVFLAKRRKKQLIAEGMPKEAAHEQAAEEAAAKLRYRNLSSSTIKRLMQ